MGRTPEKLRLRTFKVPEDIELRLANRSASQGVSKADLAREYIDALLASADDVLDEIEHEPESAADLVLRSYYLTPDQDTKLERLSQIARRRGRVVSKGRLFRAALTRGLGVAKPRPVRAAPGVTAAATMPRRRPGTGGASSSVTRSIPDLIAALRMVSSALPHARVALAVLTELQEAGRRGARVEALLARAQAPRDEVRKVLRSLEEDGRVRYLGEDQVVLITPD